MNAAPLPENADDDEIESVAEELLGVDFSSSAALSAPVDLDDDDLFGDDLDAELEQPVPAESAGSGDEEPVGATAEIEFDDDFGGELDDGQETEAERQAAPQAKSDSYWDALEGWDWDEGGGRAERAEEASAEESPVPQADERREDSTRPPAKKVDEFLDDDEFGAGLLEEAPRAPSRAASERRPPPDRRPQARAERRPEVERPRRGADEGEREPGREGRRRGRPERDERRDEGRRDRGARSEAPPPAAAPPAAEPPFTPGSGSTARRRIPGLWRGSGCGSRSGSHGG